MPSWAAAQTVTQTRHKVDGGDDDRPAGKLTLTETGPNTGVFVSKAVMLVSDDVDRAQPTNTGLSGGGNAQPGGDNHRLRRATVDGEVHLRYAVAGKSPVEIKVPVFNRSKDTSAPDTLKRVTIHIVNCKGGSNTTPKVDDAVIQAAMNQVEARYACAGIKVDWIYNNDISNPDADIISVPSESGINLNNVADISTTFMPGDSMLHPSDQEIDLADLMRLKFAANAANANVVFALYVGRLSSARGEAFADAFRPPEALANTIVIGGREFTGNSSRYTLAHELGHMLTNKGHYFDSDYGTGKVDQNENLMYSGTSRNSVPTILDTKRWWGDDISHYDQIGVIRRSRFVRPIGR